jgi:hypothetical protein
MELPSTLTDALAALSAAKADLAALNALTAEHSAVVAEFQSLKGKAADLSAALDVANANNLDLAKALDAIKASEAEASAKANAIVANLGVAPVTIQSEQATALKTQDELWAHYRTLGLNERNAFFQANKKQMQLS